MARWIKRVVALVAVSALFMGGVAFAKTFTDTTSLSLSVNKHHVKPGGHFKAFVVLSANHHFCRDNSSITLYRGSTAIATKSTGDDGEVKFTVHPSATASYHAVFGGKVKGVHPRLKTCLGSTSNTVTVTVS